MAFPTPRAGPGFPVPGSPLETKVENVNPFGAALAEGLVIFIDKHDGSDAACVCLKSRGQIPQASSRRSKIDARFLFRQE